MLTSAEIESEEQGRWQHHPSFQSPGISRQLVFNEFAPLEQQQVAIDQRLDKFLRYANKNIPYYLHKLDRGKDPFTGRFAEKWCARLPILTREAVAAFYSSLQPKQLAKGEAYWETAIASTIPNLRIEHTETSALATFLLLQREARWYRLRPDAKLAVLLNSVPKQNPDGTVGDKTERATNLASWPSIGSLYKTGSATCLANDSDIETQYEWLLQEQPAYLYSHAASLGALSRLALERADRPEIKIILALSARITTEEKALAQAAFGARVVEHYELSEFGVIASECSAGRLHVHVEHCLVSLVDEKNEPCAPGQSGRVLVTGYNNYAMLLIRFETGHLADAPVGPCPCGRTLPSIENLRSDS